MSTTKMPTAASACLSAIIFGVFLKTAQGLEARQHSGVSPVQASLLATTGREEANNAILHKKLQENSGGQMHQRERSFLNGLPMGVKSQIEKAMGVGVQSEQGFHKKLVKALPALEADCPKKLYTTKEDCSLATSIMKLLIDTTNGPEPVWTWHMQARMMVGLHFWLYTPGTLLCFTILDKDHNEKVTFEEMASIFGAQTMSSMQAIWKYLDLDGDGNITREELHRYLRAAILIRDQLPQLDAVDPKADTRKCLNMAHRVLNPPAMPQKKLGFYPKLLSIAAVAIGCIAFHCIFLTKRSSSKPVQDKVQAPAVEEAPEKEEAK